MGPKSSFKIKNYYKIKLKEGKTSKSEMNTLDYCGPLKRSMGLGIKAVTALVNRGRFKFLDV
jgi:hypothetical protein